MNRHPEIEELQDYVEELLPPGRHEEIGAHLRECPACRRELEAIADDLAFSVGLVRNNCALDSAIEKQLRRPSMTQ